ncbi:transcription factor Ouib-like [Drosophila innubila]|uniref:transcription factor Ouib-like n=1 Tax=Drosophila innubila TaxID=198719 RepID=UPI00148DFCE2|nr:transcription factor Ouib-like [Drosophila innubila]XP_034475662.1 transcription factor Ouib-like [Drosophila innubila]
MSFRRLCMKTQKKWQLLVEGCENSSLSEQENPSPSPVSPIRQNSNKSVITTYRNSDSDDEPLKTVQVMIKESKIINQFAKADGAQEHDHLDIDYVIQANTDVDTDNSVNIKIEMKGSDDNCASSKPIMSSTKACKMLFKAKQEVAIFICELCGTHVNSKASFDRHIRKHTGERPFGCEECEARFLSAAELRAHILTHTGERPFPCRYCDRRYVSYMGRLKHERIHTNERPFVCAECGKAFTNAYILKNHMLVHTGERMFRCELCQRSFQRKTHLRTHYRSNTHKLSVEKHQDAQVVPAAIL